MVSLIRFIAIAIVTLLPGLNICWAQPPQIAGYDLAWFDEFDGGSVDTSKWILVNTNQPTNNSLQDYLPSQVYVSNGNLVIKSENIPSRGLPYRSGQVISTSQQQYGRWDVRAKLPGTKGMWPAIWLLPNVGQYAWPSQGEIDIMENRGDQPTLTSSAFHYGSNPPYVHNFVYREQQTYRNGLENYHEDFHIYSVEWDPDQIRFYVDGVQYYTVSNDDVGGFIGNQTAPMQLVINTAIGGHFLENPDGSTVWPQYFEIDYVYVYTKSAVEPWLKIENQGFEANNCSLSNWSTFGNRITNVRASTQHVLTGQSAFKVYGQFDGNTNYSGLEQSLTIRPGMEVAASCDRFVAGDDSLVGSSNICQLKIDFYRKQHGVFGTSDYISSVQRTIADSGSLTDAWNNFELRATAPDEAVEARAVIVFVQNNDQGGAVHVDNLDIRRTALDGNSIRIATYNLQDSPISPQDNSDLQAIFGALGNQRVNGIARQVDLLAFQQGPQVTFNYGALEFDFETMFGLDYQSVIATVSTGGDRTGFVYNSDKLALIDSQSIDDLGFTHPPTLATFQPVGGNSNDVFSALSIQLKSGNSAANLAQRQAEAAQVVNIVNTLPPGRPVLFLGDFNMQGNHEDTWSSLQNAGALETINAPVGLRSAVWQDSVAFHPFHTEDATGAGGGMDDLFDRIFVSSGFMNGHGIEFNRESLTVFGNNGTHSLNGDLMSGSGAATVQGNLVSIGDHLPVFADFDWGVKRSTPVTSLSKVAVDNWTIRPSGPRPGTAGTYLVNVQGSNSGNTSSFAIIDFEMSGVLAANRVATVLEEVRLNLSQDNEPVTRDGPVSIYVASSAAANVNINAAIGYQSNNNGLACVPGVLSSGAELAAIYPGVHHAPDGSDLPDGTMDEVVLYRDAIRTTILNALNADGKLRLIVVPEHPDTVATYSGITNKSLTAPTISGLYDTTGTRPAGGGKSGLDRPRR